jgi:putative transposase
MFMIESFGLSQRRACALAEVSRSVLTYQPCFNVLNEQIRKRLKELANKFRRYGHWRLFVLIRREGLVVNHKRTERIYREEKLSLRIRKRRKFAAVVRVPLPAPTKPNQGWAMDFVHDCLWHGRRFRCLTITDMFTRICPKIEVDFSLPALRVIQVLERLGEMFGLPKWIRVDNGPEFISQELDEWAYRKGIDLDFIRPGKPTQNAYVESFNGKFRDECLNQNYFLTIHEAKEGIESFRIEYNTIRPHRSLDDLTPEMFLAEHEKLNQNTETLSLPVA